MNKHLRKLGLAVAVTAVMGLAGGSLVLAQAPDAVPQTESVAPGSMWGRMKGAFERAWGRGLGSDVQRETIAEALGLTVEELEAELESGKSLADLAEEKGVDLQAIYDAAAAARTASQRQNLEDQVASGDLTQDKADWLIEGQEQGFSPNVLGRVGARGSSTEDTRETLAEILGLTADELKLQAWGGRNIEDLAERAGVTVEEVEAALETARDAALRTRIADAVAAGEMTQAEADWLIEGLDNGYIGEGAAYGMGAERGARPERGIGAATGPAERDGATGRGSRGRGGMGMSGTRGGTGDCLSDTVTSDGIA